MNLYEGKDRRTSSRRNWALFVEIGVNYYRTIGTTQALQFMALHEISPEIAFRVTSVRQPRRQTRWERHVDESALRHALGARSLLAEHAQLQPNETVTNHFVRAA